jgi:predicted  nucleic acid-binding Zn-ribbon protein
MAKKTVTIEEQIPGTADLVPPKLVATCEFESSGNEDHERIKFAYMEKHFEAEMRKKFKEQIKHFAEPLASMQKDIDALKTVYNAATNSENLTKLLEQIEKAKEQKKKLDEKVAGYADYLKGGVENVAKQQMLVWGGIIEKAAEAEAKKQIKKDIQWKKFRHTAGAIIKGALVVGAAAAGIALSVATMGAATPLLAGLLVGFASLGGFSALVKVGADLKSKYNLEKNSLLNLEKDLKEISVHLGKIESKTTGLPKHLDDASRFCTERQALIKESTQSIDAMTTEIGKLNSSLGAAGDYKAVKATKEKIKELTQNRDKAKDALKKAEARDAEMADLFKKTRDLIGDLQKIPTVGTRGVTDSVKRYKNVETFIAGMDFVSVVGGASAGFKALP